MGPARNTSSQITNHYSPLASLDSLFQLQAIYPLQRRHQTGNVSKDSITYGKPHMGLTIQNMKLIYKRSNIYSLFFTVPPSAVFFFSKHWRLPVDYEEKQTTVQ